MDIYIEMYSGIAGDMLIGALLDLGASKEKLEKAVKSLFKNSDNLFELKYSTVKKNTINSYKFDVELKNNKYKKEQHLHLEHHHHGEHGHSHTHEHHSHYESETMTGLLSKKHVHLGYHYDNHKDEHKHSHDCSEKHSHNHIHSHEEHHHHDLKTINAIIDSGDFSDNVKYNAKKIFDIISTSESISHGVKKEDVHFHEVGAIDSIIDIVGVCVLLEDLQVEKIYTSSLYDGTGIQKTMHGAMPIPVPAVANIIKNERLKLNIINENGEHITPTGAAIIAHFKTDESLEDFEIKNIGIGAGTKDFEKSTNVVRVMQIKQKKK